MERTNRLFVLGKVLIKYVRLKKCIVEENLMQTIDLREYKHGSIDNVETINRPTDVRGRLCDRMQMSPHVLSMYQT